MDAHPLDEACHATAAWLARHGACAPSALLLLGTGCGILPTRLENAGRAPLSRSAPRPWSEALLHWGEFNGLALWMLDDAPLEPEVGDPAWAHGFPVWLAAAAGASALVHTSAGVSLANERGEALPPGAIALVSDHLNLSGSSPLVGLAASQLGPMFPDQSHAHDAKLRRSALATCRKLGLDAREAVAACTLGPTLDTPAERRFFARAGADVAVSELAAPLLAAAHAGLGTLALVVVAARGEESLDLARTTALAHAVAPALDDLLWELAAQVQREVRARLDEELA